MSETEQTWLKESDQFFSPASTSAIDALLGSYRKERARVEEISSQISTDKCVKYFLDGNATDGRGYSSVGRLFGLDGALRNLNASYWSRALALTDVLDHMNNDRRQEWYEQIRENKCPEFEETTVKATIKDLLLSRDKFFAERVDGIFRNLSGEHVTNSPMGFSKRMILANVHGSSMYCYKQHGYISDLRVVIAKFMGRETEKYLDSGRLVKIALKQHGQWLKVDGGAIRIRVYLKGTMHIEIHPDMAWRLNCVLSQLYPNAIPSEFRKKPEKRLKEFDLLQKPLPFSVIEMLIEARDVYEPIGNPLNDKHRLVPNAVRFNYSSGKDFTKTLTGQVIESIGGVLTRGYYQFDYDPKRVINEIVSSGCIPDYKSHQYYPTPENIARDAIEMAEIGDNDYCLEPSAGQGGLADFMPKDRTMCIEISDLHCKILAEKGFNWICDDFLKYSSVCRYSRVIMNPPYSEGRWQAHLRHAFKFLADNGMLVAILPASARHKELISGAIHEFSRVYENEFQGTSVSVVIVKVSK